MSLYMKIPFGKHHWHVFDDAMHRSLCGKATMWRVDPQQCEPVTGEEVYVRGQDCKACFRKAGLDIGDPKRGGENVEVGRARH